MPDANAPWLCVVILEADDPDELGATLRSLGPECGDGVELIIASRKAAPMADGDCPGLSLFMPGSSFENSLTRAAESTRAENLLFIKSGLALLPGGVSYFKSVNEGSHSVAVSGVIKTAPSNGKAAGVKALEMAYGQEGISQASHTGPLLCCLMIPRSAFLEAGGASQGAQSFARDPRLGERLEEIGVDTITADDFCVLLKTPGAWSEALAGEYNRGRLRFLARKNGLPLTALEPDPQPGGYLQPMLLLLALGLLAGLLPHAPERALTLSLIALLLLYPLNRGFLIYVRENSPDLVLSALAYTFARAAAWALGLLSGALSRFVGSDA